MPRSLNALCHAACRVVDSAIGIHDIAFPHPHARCNFYRFCALYNVFFLADNHHCTLIEIRQIDFTVSAAFRVAIGQYGFFCLSFALHALNSTDAGCDRICCNRPPIDPPISFEVSQAGQNHHSSMNKAMRDCPAEYNQEPRLESLLRNSAP